MADRVASATRCRLGTRGLVTGGTGCSVDGVRSSSVEVSTFLIEISRGKVMIRRSRFGHLSALILRECSLTHTRIAGYEGALGAGLGPLSSSAAADRLENQVQRAVDHGAGIHRGAPRRGASFSPAVLTDVTPQNPAHHEEFFGPVAVLYRVEDEKEAIAVANDTPFGLGSYVFTPDQDQAMRVADQIEAGMVFVNDVDAEGAELPFGGVKCSGTGRELGHLAFNEFVNKKMIRFA